MSDEPEPMADWERELLAMAPEKKQPEPLVVEPTGEVWVVQEVDGSDYSVVNFWVFANRDKADAFAKAKGDAEQYDEDARALIGDHYPSNRFFRMYDPYTIH